MRWNEADYAGWGRVLVAKGARARPEKTGEARTLLKDGPAPAIGSRRSYGDACLNSGGRAVEMTRLDRLIAFDAATGVLTAEAGVRIGEVARLFAPRGWCPAVLPGTGFATIGGCIANDVHGKNHHGAGTFGAHVTEIELLGANGRVRRITAEGAPDLFRATVGGLGQTGVILSASIRLMPVASSVMEVQERRMEGLDAFLAALDTSTATFTVGWIDATAKGAALGRGILEEAEIASHVPEIRLAPARSVPLDAPGFALSAPVVRAFNAAYFRRVPEAGRRIDRAMQDFFFPLDRIHDWNRLYGKKGFHQFQCVLPEADAGDILHGMLVKIAASGLASPLAVLKKMGAGRAGMLSFPMEGYTLAVDFRNRPATAPLLRELEKMTLAAGGRIYFAKDALARADSMAAMYDELDAWRGLVNAADPDRAFETDLVRRLGLRGERR
jgi:decaprenylphospho-beta-D-ribofuranose 2-oxidase